MYVTVYLYFVSTGVRMSTDVTSSTACFDVRNVVRYLRENNVGLIKQETSENILSFTVNPRHSRLETSTKTNVLILYGWAIHKVVIFLQI